MSWGDLAAVTVRVDNPDDLHTRLRSELSLGAESVRDKAAIVLALDRAEQNRVEARRLARAAKLEDQRLAAEIEERIAVLRTKAQESLEEDRAKGTRSKAPTKDDIRARMVADYGDEVRALERRAAEMHGALRVFEELAGAWSSRADTLRTMAREAR